MRKGVLAFIVVLSFVGSASAQDLSGILSKVGSQYAQGYLTPAANAFGVDLNSGLFHSAGMSGILPFGLHLYVGVQVPAAIVPSSDQTFSMSYLDTVTFQRSIGSSTFDIQVPATFTVNNAPTVFGDKNTTGQATFNVQKDTTITMSGVSRTFALDSSATIPTIPGWTKLSIAPLPIPQVGVGSIFGTDILIRYLPKIKIMNYGSVQLFGFGVRHSLSQYIPLIPVDIAVQLGWQNFSIYDSSGANVLKESAFAANVEVSKTLAIVTVYAGLQAESSSMDVNYSFTPPSTNFNPSPQAIPIAFHVKGKNNFRALVGLDFGLGPLNINADYNIGAINAVNLGIGLSI
jgi:hypothetical protein